MSRRNDKLNLILATSLTVLLASPAFADRGGRRHGPRHGGYHGSRADVDIESLKAKMIGGWNDATVRVRCKVEIEDAWPGERFDLMLRVTERGRELSDRRGRPVRVRVPLNRPTDIDDDEFEFDERFELPLPNGAHWNAKRLRIWAKVVGRNSGQVFDRDDASIKNETRRSHHGPIARDRCDGHCGRSTHKGPACRECSNERRAGSSRHHRTVREREVTKKRTVKKTTKKRTVRQKKRTVRRTSRKPAARAGVRIVVRN